LNFSAGATFKGSGQYSEEAESDASSPQLNTRDVVACVLAGVCRLNNLANANIKVLVSNITIMYLRRTEIHKFATQRASSSMAWIVSNIESDEW
jgi:hypothetical protein